MSYVVVLTAVPGAGLPDDLVSGVAARIDASNWRRLWSDAAELFVDVQPLPFELEQIDVNIVPTEGRMKRLLIADMDSTMIPVECIDELADVAGVRDEVVAITEPAMRGEISFEEAVEARVALMGGLQEQALSEVMAARITLTPGAVTLVRTMRAHGAYTALVSGGFTYFTERVAALIGFDEHRANRLVIEDGRLTGTIEKPILGRQAKVSALAELCASKGLDASDVLAVGDGANDLGMIRAAGHGVAFRAKPVVAEEADSRIRHGDLTALLALQGIGLDQHVH